MNKLASLLCIALFPTLSFAQQPSVNDTITRTAVIGFDINGNEVYYNPETPPLNQIAGAPKAFYTYFWEFGDGNYSFDKNPKHVYKKKGSFETRLWTTNNYDNGKPPVAKPKKIVVTNVDKDYNDIVQLDEHFGFRLQRNREPLPEQEMVVVVSYKNEKDYTTNGRIYLFYNERQFKNDNFELIDTRTYHGERKIEEEIIASSLEKDDGHSMLASLENNIAKYQIQLQDTTLRNNLPLTLEESKTKYKKWNILEFDDMEPGEERNIFHTIKTTPEMIKDTSAIVTLRGVYVPDRNYDDHKVKEMEMEIVTSHDPNKMSTKDVLLNYRFVRFKRVNYKIRFQNNGEGPARTIRLETDIPDMFDKTTLAVEDMYPKCEICPEEEVNYSCLDTMFTDKQAIFTFKNIYLPGSNQKNVKEYDSTQGFVKYSIKFGKDFHKIKTRSRTAIIFDKNEPILTNYSTTRFLPGISIGAKTGFNLFPEVDNSRSYFVGATISPYKSYRGYLQAELMLGNHTYDTRTTVQEDVIGPIDTPIGILDRVLRRRTSNAEVEKFNVDIVPVSYRYNLNKFIGVGGGPQVSLDVSNKRTLTFSEEYFLFINNQQGDPIPELFDEGTSEISDSFSDIRLGIFADITLGTARIGPSAGIRYVQNFDFPNRQWQFYAIWKF
ncbi:DUF7849 domain-containing protein [Sungkyunkwania multivorans]